MFETDLSDQDLLEQVVQFYCQKFQDDAPAQEYLVSRGLTDPQLIKTFDIGFTDRSLSRTLPKPKSEEGMILRSQLQRLGILRSSGHGHFNGCLTFPIRTAEGQIANLYGRRIGGNLMSNIPRHRTIPKEHRPVSGRNGIFNVRMFQETDEIILTDSVTNALSFWTAELKNVTCSTEPLTDEFLDAFQKQKIRRVVIAYRRTETGNPAAEDATERLMAAGHEVYQVTFPIDKDANDLLMAAGPEGLAGLVRQSGWKGQGPGEATTVPAMPVPMEPVPTSKLPDLAVSVHPKPKTPSIEADFTETPNGETEITIIFDDRRYRIRGLEKNLSFDRLKINLLVSRDDLTHVNTFDLYNARMRKSFIKETSEELYVDDRTIKEDLSRLLLKLEELQQEIIAKATNTKKSKPVELTDAESKAALKLLKDPKLTDRILADYDRLGLVGEKTGKLVCYLACVSRLMNHPLAILIQSSSASGKTALMDATLQLMPQESMIRYSAMTGQSLFYMGQHEMKQKILAVSEEAGVTEASYSLKILQSDGKLRIASAEKDSRTGRQKTQDYQAEGPVMMFLTTTSEHPDPELQNRCITLRVNESSEQTEAIHTRQRAEYIDNGQITDREAVCNLHANAQRLLKPYSVTIPWADRLTFRKDQVRMRRDHPKYLALIASITLLHQHQREKITGADGNKRLIATIEDVELAGRLASQAMGQSLDSLLPQTRQLLVLLDDHVTLRCQNIKTPRPEIRVTQRELRETLGWSDFTLRKHLARLVELEYVLVHRTGRGNGREYELLYDGQGREGKHFLLGIIDAAKLRQESPSTKRKIEKEHYVDRIEHFHEGNEPPPSPIRAPIVPHSSNGKIAATACPVMDLQPTT